MLPAGRASPQHLPLRGEMIRSLLYRRHPQPIARVLLSLPEKRMGLDVTRMLWPRLVGMMAGTLLRQGTRLCAGRRSIIPPRGRHLW